MYSFWSALGVFAHGTIATCSTQAFFIQLLPSIVLYMAALNTYFMLKIRYNVSDAPITQHNESWFRTIPIAVWLIFGTIGLSLKIFRPLGLTEMGCWIGDYPFGCAFNNTCTRGYKSYQNVNWYGWSFCFICLFLSFIVILVNSILIYTTIRNQETRNAKYLGDLLQGTGTTTSMNNTMCLQASSVAFKLYDSLKSSENAIDVNTTLPMNSRERPESAAPVDSHHTLHCDRGYLVSRSEHRWLLPHQCPPCGGGTKHETKVVR
jgi:hypothetical protein